jgi:hypothetical protein
MNVVRDSLTYVSALLGVLSSASMISYAIVGLGDEFPRWVLSALVTAALIQLVMSLQLAWKRSIRTCTLFILITALLSALEFVSPSGAFALRDYASTAALILGSCTLGLMLWLRSRTDHPF